MYAEIITIGDEILIGQITDTNSAFIAQQCNSIGISIYQITSIQDEKNHIIKALQEAEQNATIIIVTGGLGPTKDDITKNAITTYFNDTLYENQDVLTTIKKLWKNQVKQPLLATNIAQALVPTKADVLQNLNGTAPGLWITKNDKTFVFLPGVPYEMKPILKEQVLPKLQKKYQLPHIIHTTILTYGIGESMLANRLEQWENKLPKSIKLAYLPAAGKVRLRLTAKGESLEKLQQEVDQQLQLVTPLIEDVFVTFENQASTIAQVIANKLTQKKQTIATAESCTGGNIAAAITAIPGASNYYKGSIIAYTAKIKTKLLHISPLLLQKYSVVSAEVATAMAQNTLTLFNTNFAIATTGNAGPTKGSSNASIGTVFIAIATKNKVKVEQFNFGKPRQKVIEKATNKAFEMLLKEIK